MNIYDILYMLAALEELTPRAEFLQAALLPH